jgi:hypothetical protein
MSTTRTESGFSLITLTIILAVMSIAGVILIETIGVDITIAGAHRRAFEAQSDAEAGLMELLADSSLAAQAPTFADLNSTPPLTRIYDAPTVSVVRNDSVGRSYQARIQLVRVAPMLESSLQWTRALIYQVDTAAQENRRDYGDGILRGESEAEVSAEVYRVIVVQPGTIFPEVHSR